ncbi:MAG: hypothetical protein A3F17_04215 [Gammaproteobacteria bacterium RIFCSPHIGHO2_12_FULL_41_15]|nr:MAG: hypothetical protein A3F17_04215 [Gammaproteobacteria bacterium RIFCSPHIGHO2_12_FULL_41_15]
MPTDKQSKSLSNSNKNIALHLDKDYLNFLSQIKKRLQRAQVKAALAANIEQIRFYWELGADIINQQKTQRWGSHFLDQLSHDMRNAFPGMQGFSKRNLEYMRLLVNVHSAWDEFAQQPAAQLPWAHIQLLLDRYRTDNKLFFWYSAQALENGWSRSTLSMYIKSDLYERQAIDSEKVSNYQQKLALPQSDLAHEMLKNPYSFDFLTITQPAREREKELTTHIRDFLLELGSGFAFVGTQVPLQIDGEEFFIDILFYHLKLRCYVVCELKAKKFKPADLGQLSFYLSAVDEHLTGEADNPAIGILLCESRSKIIAEYALKKIDAPIGVSEYTLSKALPKNLKTALPSIEEIEGELNASDIVDDNNV